MSYGGSKAVAGIGTQLQSCTSTNGTYASPSTIDEVLDIKAAGSKADEVDVTNMDSANLGSYHEFIVTLLNAGEISFECNASSVSTTQQQLMTDFQNKVLRDYQIVLTTGSPSKWQFRAYVTKADFTYPVKDQNKVEFTLRISGARTFTP